MSDLPGQPNLSQLLETVLEAAGEEIAVARPGVITGVSSDRKTADVQPAVRRHDSSDADPVLPDVPLFFPAGCSWPVESGHPCLLVFADRSIEEWDSKGGGDEVEPADSRTHDLTDAMAIPMGPGGARAGREDDISLSLDNPAALGAVELRLQDDGKAALGNSYRLGTYDDYDGNPQAHNTMCELVSLVSELLDVLLTKTPTPLIVDVPDGTPTVTVWFTKNRWNVLAEIKARVDAIKGSL
jgi:hypothetical protein